MKLNFKDNIVAFIDVLGFKSLVFDADDLRIQKYFTYLVSDFKNLLGTNKFRYLLISDSIVISCPNIKENLQELIFVLSKMQSTLLMKSIVIRGAISYGDLFVNKTNNIVVGAGLIKAFNLEKRAIYPRVLIDRAFIPMLYENTENFMNETNKFFLEKYHEEDSIVKISETSSDNLPYINYVRRIIRHGNTFGANRFEGIITFLKSQYYSHEHFEKYNWLLNELIEEIEGAIKHYNSHPEFSSSKKRLKMLPVWLETLNNM